MAVETRREASSTMTSLCFISAHIEYWDGIWHNRHYYAYELSKKHRVFFLSPPFQIADILSGVALKKTKMRGLTKVNENLYAYVPPLYLSINHRFKKFDNIVRFIRNKHIKATLKKLGFVSPILYIWHPSCVNLIGEFDESFVVYHKYDHYGGYFGGTGKPDPKETELIKKADLFLVTSKGLYELHKEDRRDIHIVPNGVNFEFFAEDTNPIPDDIARIPIPRIGYVGVINEKVDFELLSYLCDARPEWSIVLVGPEKVKEPGFHLKLKKLQSKKNCYFLGGKDVRAVPSYIRALDVCMMCYVVNNWTYYGYPLKMHEYLACGKPTISADLPAVREFESVISIPHSKQEWLIQIEEFLKRGNSPDDISMRVDVAKRNSWAVRVETIVSLIKERKDKTS